MRTSLRKILSPLLLACLCFCNGKYMRQAKAEANSTKPNIVILLADDLGWADVGYHDSEIRTPHIDELAAKGTQLDQFYVNPACSPTRASLMTGRYTIRYGMQCGVLKPYVSYGLSLEERMLPEALKEAGYYTALTGKWHLGHSEPEYLPTRRGFDHQHGCYNGSIDYYTHTRDGGHDWNRNDQPIDEEGHATDLIRNEAVKIINQHDTSQPLFLYVSFTAPHRPLQAPESYVRMYEGLSMSLSDPTRKKPSKNRIIFSAMVTHMDDAIGRIMAALRKRDMDNDTLVLFMSDNGGTPGGGASNVPLRGRKTRLFEGGVRVPALAYWPGHIPANGIVDEPLHMVDIYPTLLKLAGVSLDQPLPLDGKDVWPTIVQGKPSPHDEIVLAAGPGHGAIRRGDWKLVRNGDLMSTMQPKGPDVIELFNIAEDPCETNNLADTHPEKLKELTERLNLHMNNAVDPLGPPVVPKNFKVPKYWGHPNQEK